MRLLAICLALGLTAFVACGGEVEDEETTRSCLWTSEDFQICVRYDQLNEKRLNNVLRTCVSNHEHVGTLVESCPTDGRVGACTRDIGGLPNLDGLHGTLVEYEGSTDHTADEIRQGCEASGGTFEPLPFLDLRLSGAYGAAMRSWLALTLLLAVGLAACGDDDDEDRTPCVAGRTRWCLCEEGNIRYQLCNANGVGYGACQCGLRPPPGAGGNK